MKYLFTFFLLFSVVSVQAQTSSLELADSLVNNIGVDLFSEEIDAVIFQTNEFLTDPTFIGGSGPFWWLSEIPDLRGSNHPENQSLGDLSRETNVLGGTKTGQN